MITEILDVRKESDKEREKKKRLFHERKKEKKCCLGEKKSVIHTRFKFLIPAILDWGYEQGRS